MHTGRISDLDDLPVLTEVVDEDAEIPMLTEIIAEEAPALIAQAAASVAA